MSDRPFSVADVAQQIPFWSEGMLYQWIRSGEVKAERSAGGTMKVRESEVRRINA